MGREPNVEQRSQRFRRSRRQRESPPRDCNKNTNNHTTTTTTRNNNNSLLSQKQALSERHMKRRSFQNGNHNNNINHNNNNQHWLDEKHAIATRSKQRGRAASLPGSFAVAGVNAMDNNSIDNDDDDHHHHPTTTSATTTTNLDNLQEPMSEVDSALEQSTESFRPAKQPGASRELSVADDKAGTVKKASSSHSSDSLDALMASSNHNNNNNNYQPSPPHPATQPPPPDDAASETTILFNAELVDEAQMEHEMEQIRQETLHKVQQDAVQAVDVVNVHEQEKQQQRRICGAVTAVILIIAGIVGPLFGIMMRRQRNTNSNTLNGNAPTPAPTARATRIEAAIQVLFHESFATATAVEYQTLLRATEWMAETDQMTDDYVRADDQDGILQRFAICQLAFATGIETAWKPADQDKWLRTDMSECQWSGITCNTHDQVVGINMAYFQLNGTIPRELEVLTHLEFLFLHGNDLYGTLPSELARLSDSLQVWYAHDNHLTGTLPSEYSLSLESLHTLNLAHNHLRGTLYDSLPPFPRAIRDLDLGHNQLSGSLPHKIWHLQNLQRLVLASNQLRGNLTTHLGSLIQLQVLDLSQNALGGPIPTAELDHLLNLQVLRLDGNTNLTGNLSNAVCERLTTLAADCHDGSSQQLVCGSACHWDATTRF